MTSYQFRYTNMFGGVVRSTAMQCDGDADAIARARDTMRDDYIVLEIFDGERTVHCGQAKRV